MVGCVVCGSGSVCGGVGVCSRACFCVWVCGWECKGEWESVHVYNLRHTAVLYIALIYPLLSRPELL